MTLAPDTRVHLVDSFEEAQECLRWLSSAVERYGNVLAFDTETTGLSPELDRPRLFIVGGAEIAWVIPLEGRWSYAGLARQIVETWPGFWVAHHAAFDHNMVRKGLNYDMPIHKIHDTRLMAHVLDSTGLLALKPLASKYVDPSARLGQHNLEEAIHDGGWTWETVPIDYERYWFYAGLDAILTWQLFQVLWPRVLADAPRSYEIELAVSWPCNTMERRGALLDRSYTAALTTRMGEFVDEVAAWGKANFGVSPGSDMQVIDSLLRDGIQLTERTKTGRYCLDKRVLSGIDHPLAGAVMQYRKIQKLHGYVASYLDLADSNDVIRTSINTVGGTDKNPFETGGGRPVRTGRMSSSKPNMQNVPTRTAEGHAIRACFIPRPGETWIKADFDQIEMRILAHQCKDPGMIAALTSGRDFFAAMGGQIYGDPNFEKSDPRRSMVKNASYAKVYQAGPEKFALTAGSTLEQATSFMRAFDQAFPGVQRFARETEAEARRHYRSEGQAYVRSPLTGRRFTAEHWKIYPVINYRIQGPAAEIMKLKIIELWQAGLDQFMLFPVHDEIDLSVPDELVPDVVDTMKQIMNDDKLLSVPITASIGTGVNWAEAA